MFCRYCPSKQRVLAIFFDSLIHSLIIFKLQTVTQFVWVPCGAAQHDMVWRKQLTLDGPP